MTALDRLEVWFVTGSQEMYGTETPPRWAGTVRSRSGSSRPLC